MIDWDLVFYLSVLLMGMALGFFLKWVLEDNEEIKWRKRINGAIDYAFGKYQAMLPQPVTVRRNDTGYTIQTSDNPTCNIDVEMAEKLAALGKKLEGVNMMGKAPREKNGRFVKRPT